MPLLGGLLISLFAQLAAFLAHWVGKKAALGAAAVATFGVLTVGLYGALALGLNAVALAWPGGVGGTFLWLAVPDIVPTCIAATIACDTAVALYRWNSENLRLLATVT